MPLRARRQRGRIRADEREGRSVNDQTPVHTTPQGSASVCVPLRIVVKTLGQLDDRSHEQLKTRRRAAFVHDVLNQAGKALIPDFDSSSL